MFRREVGLPLFLEVANFLKTQRTVVRKLNMFSRFDGTLTCDRQIDRQTQCLCVVPRQHGIARVKTSSENFAKLSRMFR